MDKKIQVFVDKYKKRVKDEAEIIYTNKNPEEMKKLIGLAEALRILDEMLK